MARPTTAPRGDGVRRDRRSRPRGHRADVTVPDRHDPRRHGAGRHGPRRSPVPDITLPTSRSRPLDSRTLIADVVTGPIPGPATSPTASATTPTSTTWPRSATTATMQACDDLYDDASPTTRGRTSAYGDTCAGRQPEGTRVLLHGHASPASDRRRQPPERPAGQPVGSNPAWASSIASSAPARARSSRRSRAWCPTSTPSSRHAAAVRRRAAGQDRRVPPAPRQRRRPRRPRHRGVRRHPRGRASGSSASATSTSS